MLVIENSEPALHAVLEMLASKQSAAKIEGGLADVRDRARIVRLMHDFRPDIFHAAALKHVPLLEQDWEEAVKTNVFGSVNVADAAVAAGAGADHGHGSIAAGVALGSSRAKMYCRRSTGLAGELSRCRGRGRGPTSDRPAPRDRRPAPAGP